LPAVRCRNARKGLVGDPKRRKKSGRRDAAANPPGGVYPDSAIPRFVTRFDRGAWNGMRQTGSALRGPQAVSSAGDEIGVHR